MVIRACQVENHAFKRIKKNIGQSRPIDLDRATKPAARLR
jgi:hypothetical protein